MADFLGQRIKFKGDKAQIEKLKEVLETGLFNFLRPMPEELNFETHNSDLQNAVIGKVYIGLRGVWEDLLSFEKERADKTKELYPELFEKYKANYEKHGHCTWYDWRIEHWKTKQDAYIKRTGKTFFDVYCAWSRPEWFIDELKNKFDKVSFEVKPLKGIE